MVGFTVTLLMELNEQMADKETSENVDVDFLHCADPIIRHRSSYHRFNAGECAS